MIYGLVRVSTNGQKVKGFSIEDQEAKIREIYPNAVIIIETITGNGRRKTLDELVEKLKPGDLIVSIRLDRFCRSTKEGLEYIDLILEKGASIHILNMGLIENTPMGRLIVTQLLAYAEFERALIIERCADGKAIAKQNPDFREGRPREYSKKQLAHALNLWKTYGTREVVEMTGISRSTLFRAKKELKDKETRKYIASEKK